MWGGAYKSVLKALNIIQKAIIKLPSIGVFKWFSSEAFLMRWVCGTVKTLLVLFSEIPIVYLLVVITGIDVVQTLCEFQNYIKLLQLHPQICVILYLDLFVLIKLIS